MEPLNTTDTPRTDALPIWKCTICGCIKHKEEEVICWNCGKGEMIYQRPTTDTPRTDAEIFSIQDCNGQLLNIVTPMFAKKLERELKASQEAYLQSVERDDYLTQALAEAEFEVERLKKICEMALESAEDAVEERDLKRRIADDICSLRKDLNR